MFVNGKHATEDYRATAMMNWEGTFLLVEKKNHLTDFSVSDTAILCFSMALWQSFCCYGWLFILYNRYETKIKLKKVGFD